jgi:hypothetical protein
MTHDSKWQPDSWLPGDPRDRSVTGFRIRNGGSHGPMSKTKYYKLKKEGRGPRETFLGTQSIITPQNELAWQEARANPKGTEARLLAAEAKRRSARARSAAVAAMKSPLHPANIRRVRSAQARGRARA